MGTNTETKIERAIYDTKLKLDNTIMDIRLLIRERDTLENQLRTLEIIRDNKQLV